MLLFKIMSLEATDLSGADEYIQPSMRAVKVETAMNDPEPEKGERDCTWC